MSIVAIVLALAAPAISAEQRAQSPCLACGADVADRSVTTAATIQVIQAEAQEACEQFLERNVDNSLAAVRRTLPPPPGGDLSGQEIAAARDRIRTKLRAGLLLVIENRVSVQRQKATALQR